MVEVYKYKYIVINLIRLCLMSFQCIIPFPNTEKLPIIRPISRLKAQLCINFSVSPVGPSLRQGLLRHARAGPAGSRRHRGELHLRLRPGHPRKETSLLHIFTH